jgi:hypothetical protein
MQSTRNPKVIPRNRGGFKKQGTERRLFFSCFPTKIPKIFEAFFCKKCIVYKEKIYARLFGVKKRMEKHKKIKG